MKYLKSILILTSTISSLAWADTSFNEMRKVLLNPSNTSTDPEAQQEINVYKAGKLPAYEVTTAKFVRNGVDLVKKAAIRTINEHKDYYPRIGKLIHSNGICFTGTWKINQDNPYSGYFKKGSVAPAVVRISTTTSNTVVGTKRGFGFAVKLFPTQDLNQAVKTANFFTVDVLMGTKIKHFMDTTLTNQPEIGFDFSLLNMMLKLNKSLTAGDKDPMFRPLYEVSEAGLKPGEVVKTPHWISIQASAGQRIVDAADFREELDLKNHVGGLKFDVNVSDTSKDPKKKSEWKKLGEIHFQESVVSYACDRQLHFPHPKLK